MEFTSATALPPEMPDLNPNMFSDSDMISIPPLDPLFLSGSDPIPMETYDLDFLLEDENGKFPDLDYTFDDSDDFFNFTVDKEPAMAIPEAIENHSNMDISETRNGDKGLEERSDSVHSQVSSQGSKTIVSGACVSSPESSNLELPQKSSVTKRKKEKVDTGGAYRSFKFQKSDDKSVATTNEEEDDDKKKTRLIRNRESAHLSRLRKKQYVEELQEKVKSMNSIIAELNSKFSYVMAENAALKQQLASASGAPPMNPYMAAPPLPYQWMPYPMYPVRGYGSQTPLVPIPKLKPKPASGCRPKKFESKKNEGKSKVKNVASISLVGIMFFVFLFGTLVPYMNENNGEEIGSFSGLSDYEGRRYYDEHKGKVLMVGDGSDVRRESGISEGGPSPLRNASEPLSASLYVPRNDKLVKIDGNLIIHSALASEKAMAFANKKNSETVESKELDLKVPGAFSSALAVPEVKGIGAMLPHSKALSSGSPDGKRVQQWFHEGGSGTPMESFMCTEVFQFDITPGAIVPSSASNITKEHLQNDPTHDKKIKNRRTLEGLPVSLMPSDLNFTKTQNKSVHGNTDNKPTSSSSSSMVVSVLLDPREVADFETDMLMPPNTKSLSRIFVVVLLDSVKYVTYSCVLPRAGLHLVS